MDSRHYPRHTGGIHEVYLLAATIRRGSSKRGWRSRDQPWECPLTMVSARGGLLSNRPLGMGRPCQTKCGLAQWPHKPFDCAAIQTNINHR
ncbi:conserved hypothetical protein [Coccidioides posadasii str. Silveira]|uniref:Uncharacterized protein n=1 Tax=Coccidioides posadasii (strain RMSCC 757 / Silveira) TaxID=443226 RepID=E9CS26_COCPS|nr:conserved hypothetical protein [Coccidioides posadasii str. Silveira]